MLFKKYTQSLRMGAKAAKVFVHYSERFASLPIISATNHLKKKTKKNKRKIWHVEKLP